MQKRTGLGGGGPSTDRGMYEQNGNLLASAYMKIKLSHQKNVHLENFEKNPRFWAKSFSTIFENFESISTEVGSPPPQIGLLVTSYLYQDIFQELGMILDDDLQIHPQPKILCTLNLQIWSRVIGSG